MRFILSEKNEYKTLINFAKENRKNQTKAERVIWQELRNSKVKYRFKRQVVIGNFIVDFVCIYKNIVVEIDGESHENQREYDEMRTKYLNDLGFKVIRFTNNEIYSDLDNVLKRIITFVEYHSD